MNTVLKVIRFFEKGIYETVEEAVASAYLTTDAEREAVRVAITPAE